MSPCIALEAVYTSILLNLTLIFDSINLIELPSRPRHHHANMGMATPMMPQGMMPVTPSVPRLPHRHTPLPRRSHVHSSPAPSPPASLQPRMAIRQQQQHGPMRMNGPPARPQGPPTMVTSPRPPAAVVSTPVSQQGGNSIA